MAEDKHWLVEQAEAAQERLRRLVDVYGSESIHPGVLPLLNISPPYEEQKDLGNVIYADFSRGEA